jgi:TRAP-type C4-dicarboxylate transport system substrate-binding protein
MRSSLIMLAAAVAVGGSTASAVAETWNMASGYPDGNFHTQNIRQFIEDAQAASGGELEITLHNNQALFKLPETKRAVQTGQIPLGEILLVQFGNEDPLFEASAIPFLAETYEKAGKLWEITKPLIEERFASQGARVLYGVPWPVQGFYSDLPINSTADVAGLKFRAYSAMTARMAEEMGMLPATIAFSEIPQAFATGLVSVMYTSPQTGIDSQAWDFTQHFTNVGGNFSMNLVIANEDAFQALASEAQQALLDAAAKAEARGWQMSQDVTTEQIQILKDKGMVVAAPTPEFLAELEAVGETLTAEWVEKAGEVGQEVVDKLAGQ